MPLLTAFGRWRWWGVNGAKMDMAVKEVTADIAESDWSPLQKRDGKPSASREVARNVHTMNGTHHAFVLVVERA